MQTIVAKQMSLRCHHKLEEFEKEIQTSLQISMGKFQAVSVHPHN